MTPTARERFVRHLVEAVAAQDVDMAFARLSLEALGYDGDPDAFPNAVNAHLVVLDVESDPAQADKYVERDVLHWTSDAARTLVEQYNGVLDILVAALAGDTRGRAA
jgi:hypothetical protein